MKKTVIERARIPGQSEAGPVHGVHEVDRVASEVGEHEAEHQVPQGRRAAEQHQGERRETDQEVVRPVGEMHRLAQPQIGHALHPHQVDVRAVDAEQREVERCDLLVERRRYPELLQQSELGPEPGEPDDRVQLAQRPEGR